MIAPNLSLKTRGTYIVLDNATPISYWLQFLPFCEGLRRPGINLKESVSRMENISSNIILNKNLYEEDTRFTIMAVPWVKNPTEKLL